MRITESLIYSRMRRDTLATQARYDDATRPLMTGQKATRPSEDPAHAQEMARLDRAMARQESYRGVIDTLDRKYQTIETSLSATVDLLSQLQTRAIQMANGTYNEEDRVAAGVEVADALATLTTLANTQVDGRYVFSGRAEHLPPFDDAGNFVGDAVGRDIPVADGVTLDGDFPGSLVYGDLASGSSAFKAIQDFKTALESNDVDGLKTLVGTFKEVHGQATRSWSRIGYRRDELSRLSDVHLDQLTLNQILSEETSAVDYAEAASRMRFTEDAYNASVSTSQRVADLMHKMLNL